MNEVYVLKKDRLTLNELKNTLEDKLNIYNGWYDCFPKDDLDIVERLLRTDLKLVINELTIELMSLKYRLRDIECELKRY